MKPWYFFSAKTLNESCLPKLAYDEGTVVYDNEPGPDKYVSTLLILKFLVFSYMIDSLLSTRT